MTDNPTSIRDLFKPSPILPMLLQYHRGTIESEIKSFQEYIIDNRFNIKKQQDSFNKIIEDQVKKNPDDTQEIYEWYEDQYYQYNEFYPATFNNSTFLSLYSFFEFNLKHLCLTLNRHKKYSIKLDDLSGQNYIEKSKKYLRLVASLDLTDLDLTWEEITKFQQLRNCIVHNNSNIIKQKDQPIKNQPLYQVIKNNTNIKLNEEKGTFIISNDQFLLDVTETIEKYLVTIIRKLEAEK